MNYRLLLVLLIAFLFTPTFGFSKAHTTSPYVNTNKVYTSDIVTVFYQQGILNIKGLTGKGNIKIYSIIGNEIVSFSNVNLYNFQRNIGLELKTMYIIHVETAGEIKLFKLVAR